MRSTDLYGISRISGLAGHSLLTAAFLVAFVVLWNWASGYVAYVGGMPSLDLEWIKAFARSADVGTRVVAYLCAWACTVGAVGAAVLTVAGLRHVLIGVRTLLTVKPN